MPSLRSFAVLFGLFAGIASILLNVLAGAELRIFGFEGLDPQVYDHSRQMGITYFLWMAATFGIFCTFFVAPVAATENLDIIEGVGWFFLALTFGPIVLAGLTMFIWGDRSNWSAFWIEARMGGVYFGQGIIIFLIAQGGYLLGSTQTKQLRNSPLNNLAEKLFLYPVFGLMVVAMVILEGIKNIPWFLRRLIPILAVAIGLYIMFLFKQAGEIQDFMALNGTDIRLLEEYKVLINRNMWNSFAYLLSIVFILCFVFPGRAQLYTLLAQRTIVGGIIGFAILMASVAGFNYYILDGGFSTLIHSLVMPGVFILTGLLISWVFNGYGYWGPQGHQQH
jgi:hypothetical protein